MGGAFARPPPLPPPAALTSLQQQSSPTTPVLLLLEGGEGQGRASLGRDPLPLLQRQAQRRGVRLQVVPLGEGQVCDWARGGVLGCSSGTPCSALLSPSQF